MSRSSGDGGGIGSVTSFFCEGMVGKRLENSEQFFEKRS